MKKLQFVHEQNFLDKKEDRKVKTKKSQDYAQTHQRNCTFMNSISGLFAASENVATWPMATPGGTQDI